MSVCKRLKFYRKTVISTVLFTLAGYSVELTLKAKICDRLGIPNLFDLENPASAGMEGIGDVRRALKTHDLFVLMIYSGLKAKFDAEKSTSKELSATNSVLLGNWNESARYKPVGHFEPTDVLKSIELLKDNQNGLLQWINKN